MARRAGTKLCGHEGCIYNEKIQTTEDQPHGCCGGHECEEAL